jgi:hypothetical protein
MEELNRPIYASDHIYLSAFICCQGHQLIGTKTDGDGRIRFLFGDSNELRSSIAEFMAGGRVEARQYSFTLLKLKKFLPKLRVETDRKCRIDLPVVTGDPAIAKK